MRPRAVAIAERVLGDRDEAEDLAQEALLRAYLGLSALRDPDRFESWVCGIAVNLAKMRRRQRAAQTRAQEAVARSDRRLDPFEEQQTLSLVREAIALLPPGQQEAVVMHYVAGLSCDEIASVLGTTSTAVRVRLHRARVQLREQLTAVAPVTVKREPTEDRMREMRVHDVLVRVGEDSSQEPGAQRPPGDHVVVLRDSDDARVLPILIGEPEGFALALSMGAPRMPRPMTHDLMADLVRAMGGRVECVTITDLRNDTFHAAIGIAVDGRMEEVDARPSDAINLAVRVGAPIYAADAVLKQRAVAKANLRTQLEGDARERVPDLGPGTWASLASGVIVTLPAVCHRRPGITGAR